MPSYDFVCPKCGDAKTITKSMSDDSGEFCNKCQISLRRIFSPNPVHFRGTGFYTNDKKGPLISE